MGSRVNYGVEWVSSLAWPCHPQQEAHSELEFTNGERRIQTWWQITVLPQLNIPCSTNLCHLEKIKQMPNPQIPALRKTRSASNTGERIWAFIYTILRQARCVKEPYKTKIKIPGTAFILLPSKAQHKRETCMQKAYAQPPRVHNKGIGRPLSTKEAGPELTFELPQFSVHLFP